MMIRTFLQVRTGVVLVGASLIVAGSLAACGSDVSETTTAVGSGGSTATGVGGAGGAPGTGGSTSTVADTVASSTTGPPGSDVCTPGQMDGMCVTCIKEKCCTELEACDADTTCKCFRECKIAPGGMGMAGTEACITMCGDPGELNQAIRLCRNEQCSMNCMGGGMTGGGMTGGGGMAGSGGSG
ncbi:MAG: hypothetical protein VB934_13325, partial [Polyangiaceae bacterium]